MKRTLLFLALLILAGSYGFAQQEIYTRTTIPVPKAGFSGGNGNIIAGVDLDGDGKLEIYAVNNDWTDTPDEMVPMIYKYEWNSVKSTWDSVWSAALPVPYQNTWPGLTVADMDGDGRKEIIYAPVNNFGDAAQNPTPQRIFVFESVPGQEYLGIAGTNGYVANASWNITSIASEECRPFKLVAADFNKDGKNEIVFADRQANYRYGVISVNKVGNTGADTAGTVWTLMTSGKGKTIPSGSVYDVAVVDSTIFAFASDAAGTIVPITYAGGVFTQRAVLSSLVPGGTWKSAQVVDLNKDGKKEIVVGGWTAAQHKAFLLQKTNDSVLTSTMIADFTPLIGTAARLYGGGVGDIDNDGNPDFVFGTRAASPDGQLVRLSYKGGDMTLPASYAISSIERGFALGGRIDEVVLANLNATAGDEIVYSDGSIGTVAVPVVILSDGKKAVNVTFMANTATVPDTLKPSSIVQVRGGSVSLTWGNDTKGQMKAAGGDYWKWTGIFPVGETSAYKYVTKTSATAGDGWENDINEFGNGNRQLIVGQNDTTIALEYVNGSADQQKQFWKPFVPRADSIAVMFRINMANEENFNKATMKIGVRGGLAPLDWGNSANMVQEPQHGNGGSRFYDASNFYNVVLKFPKATVGSAAEYKFVMTGSDGTVTWEDNIVGVSGNRTFTVPAADTTLYWKFWRNVGTKPPTGNDTAQVTFTANLLSAVNRNSFKLGDTVIVQYGWANSAKAVVTDTLKRQGITGYVYKSTTNLQVLGTKIDAAGAIPLYYQYYLVRSGNTIRETYYNFNYSGSDNSLAERRAIAVTAKTIAAFDTSVNLTNSYRQPFWRNTKQLARNVALTVTCDLRPAYYQVAKGDTLNDIQGAFNITPAVKDSIWKWGVFINGPLTTGWGTWGAALAADTARKMYDDGTHGDKTAGDRIYTRIIKLWRDTTAYSNNTVGQEFKFGIRGGDNEGGKGGFGNNHIENVDDSQPTATLDNQYGSINPKFYNAWNFDTHATGVEKTDATVPMVYALEQNYPNPFNPTTTIRYSLPASGKVMLTVFNVLGQEVLTLVNGVQNAGVYTATFDASRLASGMYLYRIEAGSFNAVKKMMLVK